MSQKVEITVAFKMNVILEDGVQFSKLSEVVDSMEYSLTSQTQNATIHNVELLGYKMESK